MLIRMESIEELRYLVLAAQREGSRALTTALKPHDLTPSQAEAIACLRDARRPLSVREIGQRLVCEGGSPSRLISTLVRKGLVATSSDPMDGRATVVSLTADGKRVAQTVADVERDLYELLGAMVDAEGLPALIDGLRTIVAGLPAGQALQRRIDDKDAVSAASRD